MSETKFSREYLHEQLWELRDAFGTEDFWNKPGAVEIASKAIWFVFWQTESRTAFDQIRTEATLSELRTRWRLIQTLRNPYQAHGESC